MYGGEGERQLRATLAAALGIAAALLPWPADGDRDARLVLLAPRGRVDAAPTRVCWSSDAEDAEKVEQLRLCVRDRFGAILISRTAEVAANPRVLPLLPEERRQLAELPEATIELSALDRTGELIGMALPARIALREKGPNGRK